MPSRSIVTWKDISSPISNSTSGGCMDAQDNEDPIFTVRVSSPEFNIVNAESMTVFSSPFSTNSSILTSISGCGMYPVPDKDITGLPAFENRVIVPFTASASVGWKEIFNSRESPGSTNKVLI